MNNRAVIFAASHRKGGNSDLAAELLAQGIAEAGGESEIIHLRDYDINHCLACTHCEKAQGKPLEKRCVFAGKDEAHVLFLKLMNAPLALFASPIYFYALPSRFKAWIDRSQQLWWSRDQGDPLTANLPGRKAYAVFLAGRPTGSRLFDGAEITLKYFLNNVNMELAPPLCLPGFDAPEDLKAETGPHPEIVDMARKAWQERCPQ